MTATPRKRRQRRDRERTETGSPVPIDLEQGTGKTLVDLVLEGEKEEGLLRLAKDPATKGVHQANLARIKREIEAARVQLRVEGEVRALAPRAHENEETFVAYLEALARAGRREEIVKIAGAEIKKRIDRGERASEPYLRELVERHNEALGRAG